MSALGVRPRGKTTIFVLVTVTIVTGVLVLWRGSWKKASAAGWVGVDDLAGVLVRVGLSPSELAAAGVRGASVTDVVGDVEAYLSANP